MPVWYVSASSIHGYELTAGAIACTYTAGESGGFSAPVGSFTITVEREGHSWRYDERGGRCADDVIAPGDRVMVTATIAAEAGAESGCSL